MHKQTPIHPPPLLLSWTYGHLAFRKKQVISFVLIQTTLIRLQYWLERLCRDWGIYVTGYSTWLSLQWFTACADTHVVINTELFVSGGVYFPRKLVSNYYGKAWEEDLHHNSYWVTCKEEWQIIRKRGWSRTGSVRTGLTLWQILLMQLYVGYLYLSLIRTFNLVNSHLFIILKLTTVQWESGNLSDTCSRKLCLLLCSSKKCFSDFSPLPRSITAWALSQVRAAAYLISALRSSTTSDN